MNVRHRPRAHGISVIGNFREAKPHRVARAHLCYASENRRHREHERARDHRSAVAELRRCQRGLCPHVVQCDRGPTPGPHQCPRESATRAHENARRLERSELPGVLMIRDSGRDKLEHADHDRANNGERDIGGDNAQSADQSTIRHRQTSGVTSLPAPTSQAR